jgi:hypothetical protein
MHHDEGEIKNHAFVRVGIHTALLHLLGIALAPRAPRGYGPGAHCEHQKKPQPPRYHAVYMCRLIRSPAPLVWTKRASKALGMTHAHADARDDGRTAAGR